MDVSDGTVHAVDSVRGDHETATVVLDEDDLPCENPPSTEAVEGVSFYNTEIGAGGPSMRDFDASRRDEPSSSRPADDPISSVD